jgi:glycosyltransferase involved in cell wall biosynthesis
MIHNGVYFINHEPKIVSMVLCKPLRFLQRYESISGATLLLHLPWNHANFYRMARTKWRMFIAKTFGFDPILVTNSVQEEAFRKLFLIPGFHSMHYVYVNEDDYRLLPVEKKYDAIYTAQMDKFKRMPLAREISSIYILTYQPGVTSGYDLHSFCPELKHAHFNTNFKNLEEKNFLYNSSRVGLALSREEGPMLASLEYMLCGLPVLSTASKGGRDQYYDDEYVIISKAEPRAVKEGVDELISRNIDPSHIREKTIKKLVANKQRYIHQISEYTWKKHRIELDEKRLFNAIFTDSKRRFKKFAELQVSSSDEAPPVQL